MDRVRCGLLLLAEDMATFGGLCRAAEDAGFGLLGVGDSQSIFRDVHVALTVAACETRRVRLGPMVTNPVSRHLTVTASAMASLQELSGGRAVLGLGSGDSALRTVAAPPATLAGLEAAVLELRALFEGRPVPHGGDHWQIRRPPSPVPIWLAAEGPRTLRLAGRVADGVVVGLGLTPEVVSLALHHLAAGAAEAGRTLDDLDVW